MNIYIGYNCSNDPLGVLLSTSREKAMIAWAGMGVTPHHVEVLTENDIHNNNLGVYGVVFLLCSNVESVYIDGKFREIIVFRRGL